MTQAPRFPDQAFRCRCLSLQARISFRNRRDCRTRSHPTSGRQRIRRSRSRSSRRIRIRLSFHPKTHLSTTEVARRLRSLPRRRPAGWATRLRPIRRAAATSHMFRDPHTLAVEPREFGQLVPGQPRPASKERFEPVISRASSIS